MNSIRSVSSPHDVIAPTEHHQMKFLILTNLECCSVIAGKVFTINTKIDCRTPHLKNATSALRIVDKIFGNDR